MLSFNDCLFTNTKCGVFSNSFRQALKMLKVSFGNVYSNNQKKKMMMMLMMFLIFQTKGGETNKQTNIQF